MPHTLESFYGGGNARTFGANIRLASKSGRNQRLNPTSAGLVVTLPDARYFGQSGAPIFHLLNIGSHGFDVEDADGNFVSSVPAGEEGVVLLTDASQRSGHYHIKLRPYSGPQTSSATPTPTPSGTPTGTSTSSGTSTSTSSGSSTSTSSGTTPTTYETGPSRTLATGPV